jgi:serine/threonine protein phosphatase PrpC
MSSSNHLTSSQVDSTSDPQGSSEISCPEESLRPTSNTDTPKETATRFRATPPRPPKPPQISIPPAPDHSSEARSEPRRIDGGGSTIDSTVLLLANMPGRSDGVIDRPDSVLDAGTAGKLAVRAASVRGYAHRWARPGGTSSVRQDEYAIGLSTDRESLLIAVADGVSAGPRSHRAAHIATRGALRAIKAALDEAKFSNQNETQESKFDRFVKLDYKTMLHEQLSRDIAVLASKEINIDLKSIDNIDAELMRRLTSVMATTLIVGIISCHPDKNGKYSGVLVPVAGDSSAWKLCDENWTPLTHIKDPGSEIFESSTSAIPALTPKSLESQRITLSSGEALILMTDGLSDPLGKGENELGRQLAKDWAHPPDKWLFGQQLDFHAPGHGDDRTVVAIWPLQS